ncbi:MAG TPA: helix-turn-helix transcriptional regulator [Burkholderiaceae bacterium]|nr:helix-turn-helix transcriptional regulator [Burkholderiaceae bacterium]
MPVSGCRRRRTCDELNGQLSVRSEARDLGVSVRTLQLQFAQAVGLSPKEYARIRRLQATLHLLDNGATALAEAAQRAGFADQAHATRELRTVAGLTPARLRQALAAEREGGQALALAAAFIRGQALDRHR